MTLAVHGSSVDGIFRLLGADENSATYALGWALDRCPSFLNRFLKATVGPGVPKSGDQRIDLQRRGGDLGYTDVEIKLGDTIHIIVEAKAGWLLPTQRQLERYCARFPAKNTVVKRLVTLSATPDRIAQLYGVPKVGTVPVVHLSWTDVRNMARLAHSKTRRFEEKKWLREVVLHLEEFVAMDRRSSNEVYVLALRTKPIRRGNSYTWVDVVERDNRYFHPVGGSWPTDPPNYLGFRYRGRLQSVRHVNSTTIVNDLRSVDARWPRTNRPHFVYRLGSPMLPAKEVKSGNLFRAARARCAIDTLLSGQYRTISEAREATKERFNVDG